MTLRERLSTIGQRIKGQESEPVIEVKEKSNDLIGGYIDFGTAKLSNETTVSSKLIEANREWVYRNNDVIAKEVSNIEFQLFETVTVKGETVLKEIEEHELLETLDRFNEATSRMDGVYITQSHKKLAGDAFWLLEGKAPNITNIYVLQPDKITVNLGSDKLIKSYSYKDTINGKTISATYSPEEIIHFKAPNPNNPIRGLGAVEATAGTIDLDNYTAEANKKFFERGAITNFVLTTEQNLNDEQRKRLRAELKSNYSGIQNAFKVMLLQGGIKPESIQMSNKDMEFLSQLEWYRDKIMSLFGNTKVVLGITDDVNRANAEASVLQWKRSTIVPEMASLVNTLNEFLVPYYGDNLILGFKDPVPDDRASKIDEAIKLTSGVNPIISIEEAREMLGYDTKDPQSKALDSIKYIDKAVFRNRKMYSKQRESADRYKLYKEKAKEIVSKRKTKETINKTGFSDQQLYDYAVKQMDIVDTVEPVFISALLSYIGGLVKEAIARVDDEDARKENVLLDRSKWLEQAVYDFQPVLMEAVLLGGNEAVRLLKIDTPYLPQSKANTNPRNVRAEIEKYIRKFAKSMIDTDIKIMTDIISIGATEGLGSSGIKQEIQDKFFGEGNSAKTQAERVARTEVARAVMAGTQDAYLQHSDVVTGKQWLSVLDNKTSDICEELDGKIVDVDQDYVKKGQTIAGVTMDYDDVGYPPAHPNCRSTIVPVVLGISLDYDSRIKTLEALVDKRSKAFKDLQEEKSEQEEYIKELEKLVGL